MKRGLKHILELSLQDLNPFEHPDPRPSEARELMMLTLAGPHDFNQLRPGLAHFKMTFAPLRKTLHEYVRALSLKLPQFYCSRRHCFGKYPGCSPLLVASKILPFPFLLFVCLFVCFVFWFLVFFGFVVSFSSTLTKR